MPHEHQAELDAGRRRLLRRCQIPIVTAVVVLTAVFAAVQPSTLLRPEFIAAIAATALGLLLSLGLPWSAWPLGAHVVLGVVNFVAAAAINVAIFEGTGTPLGLLLTAFPVLWLSYGLPAYGAVGASIGTVVTTFAPAWYRNDWPETGVDWITLSAYPVVATVVALAVSVLARRLLDNQAARDRAVSEAARINAISRVVIDEMDAWLTVFDRHGVPVLDNDALPEVKELATYDPESRMIERLYFDDRTTPVPPEQQPLMRIFAGIPVVNETFWAGSRGHQRAVLVNGRRVCDDAGQTVGFVIVTHEITDLHAENLAREDVLAALSHELRSPLTSILGYADLLADSVGDGPGAQAAETVRRNAEHMLELTNRFLDVNSGLDAPALQPTIVAHLITHAVDTQRAARDWGARTLDAAVEPETVAEVDPNQLLEVLNNLLGNAVKYSPEDAHITVTQTSTAGALTIEVRNTGEPIDPREAERIFDRFYRSPSARAGGKAGLGIGLALSRRIVAAHRGTLTADPTPDGTRFVLTLPR